MIFLNMYYTSPIDNITFGNPAVNQIKFYFIFFLNLGRSTLNQQRSPGTQMRHLGHLAWNIILDVKNIYDDDATE